MISTRIDDFRRCLARRSPMKLVLYRCEETAGNLGILVVVDRALSVNIRDLLIEPTLA